MIRFREQRSPLGSIAQYLRDVHAESVVRGYRFDAARIGEKQADGLIDVPRAQIEFEWGHLGRKLEARAPGWVKTMSERQRERGLPGRTEGVGADRIVPHPLFRVVEGAVEAWEVR